MKMTVKDLILFIDEVDYLSKEAKDDLDFMECFGWHVENYKSDFKLAKELKKKIKKVGFSKRLVNKGCQICGKKTEFLVTNGFCLCRMNTYKVRYRKRHGGEFNINDQRCVDFARLSWVSQNNTWVRRNGSRVKGSDR